MYAAAPILADDGSVVGSFIWPPLCRRADCRRGSWFTGTGGVGGRCAGAGGRTLLARRITRPSAIMAGAAPSAKATCSRACQTGAALRELDVLGGSFNRMIASLRQSDQAKTAFISDVTHELRTPLTVIKGTIETLEDGARTTWRRAGASWPR